MNGKDVDFIAQPIVIDKSRDLFANYQVDRGKTSVVVTQDKQNPYQAKTFQVMINGEVVLDLGETGSSQTNISGVRLKRYEGLGSWNKASKKLRLVTNQ